MTVDEKMNLSKQKVAGIGGWLDRGLLCFFALSLVLALIVAPIILIVRIVELVQRNGEYAGYNIPTLFVDTVFYFYLWVVAVQFFKKYNTAPETIIGYFISRIFASMLLFVIGYAVIGRTNELAVADMHNYLVVYPGIVAVFWILYFKISKRVKTTFVN
jgi:ABC-type multidrug transport system permease subunit